MLRTQFSSRFFALLAVLTALISATPARGDLVINRGLPTANLNNVAGANRSNVSWGFSQSSGAFSGDDFTLAAGSTYRIDTIRTWTIGTLGSSLGSQFSSVSLYGGVGADNPLTVQEAGTFVPGTNDTTNTNIVITPTTYAGDINYQGTSGHFLQIYEVDFTNLNWVVDGGSLIQFGVQGLSASNVWFNLASNAALSGSPQDGSDNMYDEDFFYAGDQNYPAGYYSYPINSDGDGWDKSSDINVQVFADTTAVATPEPATWVTGAIGVVMGLAWTRSRRKSRSA